MESLRSSADAPMSAGQPAAVGGKPGGIPRWKLLPALRRPVGRAAYRDLVLTFAARSLKLRYRGSILGVFWSLSNPLLMTGLYAAIFGTAFSRYYDNSIARYVLAVFTALAVLGFFTATTSQALGSIVANGPLVNKIAVPLSVFPVSTVVANTFQLAVGTLPLLLAVVLYRTHSPLHVIALFGPITGLLLTSLGFSLALSPLYAIFRDLPYLYEVFTFGIYMTTPVFYPLELVPESVRGWLQFNPIATIVESVRAIALVPTPPSPVTVALPLVAGTLSLAVGAAVFFWLRRDIMDVL